MTYDQWKTASPYDGLGDDDVTNYECNKAFPDYESLGELYRCTYKYTACGPSVGALIFNRDEPKWLYCEDLYQLGSFDEMDERGDIVVKLSVGSIVEGCNFDAQTIEIDCSPYDSTNGREEADADVINRRFYTALSDVEAAVDYIWSQTHGCEDCDIEGEWGHDAINSECKTCHGEGIIC